MTGIMRYPTPSDFRERLRALMRDRGVNARQLSIRCRRAGYELDASMLSRFLNQRVPRYPSLRSLMAIAAGLRCSLDQLGGGNFERPLPDRETEQALKFWRAFTDMPASPEKRFIRAKLLQNRDTNTTGGSRAKSK